MPSHEKTQNVSIHLQQLVDLEVSNVIRESRELLQEEGDFQDPLAQVFLQPFKDVMDTARHGLEKTTTQVWGNALKFAKQAATLFLPGVPVDAFTSEIDERIQSHLQNIDGKYKDVLTRNYDMMRARDLWGVPFLLNPVLMTGINLATKSPEVALAGLEAIAGGHPTITKMRERLKTINTRVLGGGFQGGKGAGDAGGSSDGGDYGFYDHVDRSSSRSKAILEQAAAPTSEEINKNFAAQIAKAGSHPVIQAAIDKSPIAKQLRQIAEQSIVETVQEAIAFSTYDEMAKKLGSKFAQVEKQVMGQLPQGATPEQQQAFKNALVPEMKNLIKQMYIKQVQGLAGNAPKGQNTQADLANSIKKIQGLK